MSPRDRLTDQFTCPARDTVIEVPHADLVLLARRCIVKDLVDWRVVHLFGLDADHSPVACDVRRWSGRLGHDSPFAAVINAVTMAARSAKSSTSPRNFFSATTKVRLSSGVAQSAALVAVSSSACAASYVISSTLPAERSCMRRSRMAASSAPRSTDVDPWDVVPM